MPSSYPWWRHATVYQVYVRSFADGNGDGTGDIAGLRSRLPYVAELGVDAIWVNPWYVSPLHDGGYDVADYRKIDPRFGTSEAAAEFIAEASRLGIRLLVDLVPNHTSSEHQWFQEALDSGQGSLARARYHFLPGRGPDGAEPPTNWKSVFGGPAWSRVADGDWYLHLFDHTQPDLNWENPEVIQEFISIIRFWLDRGAAGVRVDVAHSLIKDTTWPDLADTTVEVGGFVDASNHPFWDRAGVHDVIRGWRAVLDEYPDTMMVAEAWVEGWDRLGAYLRPDEYHQAFDFEFLTAPWNAVEMRGAIDASLTGAAAVGSVPTWVLSNHDVVRHRTRYGIEPGVDAKQWLLAGDRTLLDDAAGARRARAGALLMLSLPGSAYVYQGEELGLPEVHDLPIAVLDDPVWQRSGHTEKGRDGCRVPIPWERSGESFGFGSNGSWLPQPPGWGEFSVEAQQGDNGSTLELYRKAISIRAQRLIHDEDLEWLDLGPEVLAFRRGSGLICVVNLGNVSVELPPGDVILSSAPFDDVMLAPDNAVWLG